MIRLSAFRRFLLHTLVVAMLLASPLASALSKSDFDQTVDFSVTLKNIANAASGGERLPSKAFIFDATVSEITVLDPEQATFKVRVQLISGEWVGLEDVKSYSCYVTFSGPQYFSLFPAKPPRDATDIVTLNAHLLVAARAGDVTTSPTGEKLMNLDGFGLRVIP